MTTTQSGLLLIADISGYTMFLSASELDHAQEILSTLLNGLIDHTRPPFVISRTAGDAVISYAVGQRQAMEDVADLLPIWRYSAVGDDRTRPSHMALDGLEYPANHPFWQLHYPPWEFNCRCDVIPLPAASSSRIRRDAPSATLDFDDDGLPIRAAVDGTVTSISPGRLSGAVTQSPTLDDVLKASADRARTSRQRALD